MPRFFTPETFAFLDELNLNNHREWFQANKQRYEDFVREPALTFIATMRPKITAISPHFLAEDKRAGGSLMRIYRDTRFGTDKTPYKTNIGIQFRHAGGKDVHAPGLYVHVEPDGVDGGFGGCFVGVGMWMPPNPQLNLIRAKIDDEQARWRGIVEDAGFVASFSRAGESLKRPPRGYDADHPLVDDLKRKSHIVTAPLTIEDVLGDRLDSLVAQRFEAAADYTRFLCEAVGAPF